MGTMRSGVTALGTRTTLAAPATTKVVMCELKRWIWMSMVLSAVSGGGSVRAEECIEPDCIRREPCETASDCGVHRKCQATTVVKCSDDLDLSCNPGEDDDDCFARTSALKQTECDRADRNLCLPVWQLDCSSDAFCGEGLQCVDRGCVATGECKIDGDCPELFHCGVIDGGYCMSGSDCVGGQRKLHRCLPPRVEGDAADGDQSNEIGEPAGRDMTESSAADDCSVRRAGAQARSRTLGWTSVIVLVAAVARSRRVRRRR